MNKRIFAALASLAATLLLFTACGPEVKPTPEPQPDNQEVTITPQSTTLDFGSVFTKQSSAKELLVSTTNYAGDLTCEISGAQANQFAVTKNEKTAEGSYTLEVKYTAAEAAGTAAATLKISAGDKSAEVALKGSATEQTQPEGDVFLSYRGVYFGNGSTISIKDFNETEAAEAYNEGEFIVKPDLWVIAKNPGVYTATVELDEAFQGAQWCWGGACEIMQGTKLTKSNVQVGNALNPLESELYFDWHMKQGVNFKHKVTVTLVNTATPETIYKFVLDIDATL